MNWTRTQVAEAVTKVLRKNKWPVYKIDDDVIFLHRGLDKYEYVKFVCDVLKEMQK